MQIKFKHISIENFCGIKQLDTPLYDRTAIKGQCSTGKSTIRNAIFWVFCNELANGSAVAGIRPHDENGVDIDFIDISVILTLDVDGKEITLKKVQKQKWRKPRGKSEKAFDGNENFYEINGIPKDKEKDYLACIEEKIVPIEKLAFCINPYALLSLEMKKKRDAIFSMQSLTDADIAKTDKKFEPIADMLEDGTIAELIARSKKRKKDSESAVDKIKVEISALERQKEDIDVAELELGKKSLEGSLEENRKKQSDTSKQFEEYQTLSDGISKLRFQLSDIERTANADIAEQRRNLQMQIETLNLNIMRNSDELKSINWEIEGYKNDAESGEKQRQILLDRWKSVQAERFDENTAICPTCHRELPEDERERLMIDFEKTKSDRIAQIEKGGLEVKQDIDNAKEMLPRKQEQAKEKLAEKEKLEQEVAGLKKQLSELPESIDISDRGDVQEINRQIAEKEQEMQKFSSVDEIKQSLKAEEQDLQSKLIDIKMQLAKSEKNVEIDQDIEELQKKRSEINQQATDEQKTLDLLEDLNRAKVEMLTESINKHFNLVKWQMFKPQVNGGFAECCKATIGGTAYDGLLNNGNRILAEIDICMAFQKASDIICPIIVDNTESVDDWLIPETQSQLIMLEHDKKVEKLTIEEVKNEQ